MYVKRLSKSATAEKINVEELQIEEGLRGEDLWNLIRFMMDTLRQKGATNFPDNIRATNEFFSPRNHAGYFRQSLSKIERTGHIYGFFPIRRIKLKRGRFA